ncbi:hypothetical protein Tco_1285099 [Tanacetum coccineum]
MCPTYGKRNNDMVHKVVYIICRMWFNGENMPVKASEEHCIRKHHQVTLKHTSHSLGHVVGEVETFLVGKTIKHVNKASIWMILIPREANGIFTKNGFPFSEIRLHFGEHHWIRVGNNGLTLNGAAFGRRSFIEDGAMHQIGINQGSKIDEIRVDAVWKGCNRRLETEHAYTFARDTKFLSKFMETENNIIVSNDESDGNCFVQISNDSNAFVKLKNKYGANLFVNI